MKETIEWLNYWIENADDDREGEKRVLLLGDSVARDYRKSLNRMLQDEGYVVDLLAMSFSIFDELMIKEISHFIKDVGYHYQYILFNLGTHHGYSIMCKNDEIAQKNYFYILKRIFRLLEETGATIITISGTPENINMNDSNNEEIKARNQILKAFSLYYNYRFIDLYECLEAKKFLMTDKFHFLNDGSEYISSVIKKAMGFEKQSVPINMIHSVLDLNKILGDSVHIYIYGDGKRGELLKKYLGILNHKLEGFIVSEEFFQRNNCEHILLEEISDSIRDNGIILVTPENKIIWDKLNQMRFPYCTLDKRIYIYIEEYVNICE